MTPLIQNHYTTLGLEPGCPDAHIRTAYRTLARRHHPDFHAGSPEAVARTQALNAAYEVLGDPERRRAYDAELERSGRAPVTRRAAPATLTEVVHLSVQDLLQGVRLTVQVRDPAHPQGLESLPLVVPPGTAPGARLRLRRAPPFEAGWVVVRVKARPDARFKPRGSDLRCDLRISTQRAAQGGPESVRGATGRMLLVQIPPRVDRGAILRVPGEGLPRARGGRGDLLVRIVYRPAVRIVRGG